MIIVLGAPRSGTKSSARALELLNLNVLRYCPITRCQTEAELNFILDSGTSAHDAIVSSGYSEHSVSLWLTQFPDAVYINCTRDEDQRKASLARLGCRSDIDLAEINRCVSLIEEMPQHYMLDCSWSDRKKWSVLYAAYANHKVQESGLVYPKENLSRNGTALGLQ